jgi:hypothetical protein
VSIFFATFWLNYITCLQIYHKKALLNHLPMSIIVKTAHSPKYMVMAVPDLIECIPISSLLMLSQCSLIATTASWSALMMFWEVTCVICPLIMIVEIGVSEVVPGYPLILQTIAAAEQTGQSFTSPEAICIMVSIFLSFFCFSNVNKTQSENFNSS